MTVTWLRSTALDDPFLTFSVIDTAGPEISPGRCATALIRVTPVIEALMPPPTCALPVNGTAASVVTVDDLTVWRMLPPLGAATGTVRAGTVDSDARVVSADDVGSAPPDVETGAAVEVRAVNGEAETTEVAAGTRAASAATDDVEPAAAGDADDTVGIEVEEQAASASADARTTMRSALLAELLGFTMIFQTAGSRNPCRGTISLMRAPEKLRCTRKGRHRWGRRPGEAPRARRRCRAGHSRLA